MYLLPDVCEIKFHSQYIYLSDTNICIYSFKMAGDKYYPLEIILYFSRQR